MSAKHPRPGGAATAERTIPAWVDLVAVAGVALIVRWVWIASLRGTPVFEVLQVNAARYDAWAKLILAGQAPPPPYEQGPAYPYFLSFFYAFAGEGAWGVAVVQCLAATATVVLLHLVAARLGGRVAGLATGLLAAAYGPFIYFTAEVLPATLFVLSCAGAMAAAVVPRERRWRLAGALWAVAYLFRSNTVLALPFALLHAWAVGGRAAALRLLVPFALVAAALLALNLGVGGEPVWSTTGGGVNLWIGNNPTSDGVNPFFGPDQHAVDAAVRAEATTAAAADRAFTRRALAFWATQPGAALELAAKKLLWTFSAFELSNDVAIDWKQAHSPVFAITGLPLGFAIVLVFAFVYGALVWFAPPPHARDLLVLAVPAMLGIATCVLFFTNARFRLPLALALLVLAGLGIAAILDHVRRGSVDVRRAASASLAATLAVVLAYGNWFEVRDYRIPQLDVNAGAMEREARNFDSAILFLRSGLGREPRDPIGWVHLALALEQAGHVDAAREAYESGLGFVPGDPQITEMFARFRQRNRG